MAARFSSMRTVLGAREYSEILGRHGYPRGDGYSQPGEGSRSLSGTAGCVSSPVWRGQKALGSAEYAKILRELRLNPKAKLNPDQAVRVFNHMEETLNARQ